MHSSQGVIISNETFPKWLVKMLKQLKKRKRNPIFLNFVYFLEWSKGKFVLFLIKSDCPLVEPRSKQSHKALVTGKSPPPQILFLSLCPIMSMMSILPNLVNHRSPLVSSDQYTTPTLSLSCSVNQPLSFLQSSPPEMQPPQIERLK